MKQVSVYKWPCQDCCAFLGAPNSETRNQAAVGGPSFCFEAFGARERHGLKTKNPLQCSGFRSLSDPVRIQTCNLLIRSQVLYSVELVDL